jgi:hypothetical protein
MGIGVCWGCNYIVQFIRKDVVTNSNYMAILRVSLKWAVVVLKIFLLGSVWLTVPPLLLGRVHSTLHARHCLHGLHLFS